MEARTGALVRRTAAVLLALLALLATGRSVSAQAAAPQIEVRQFGWQADGTLTPRGWNPIFLRVSGANEAAARVQVTLKLSVGSTNQTFITPVATYAQDVSLPAGTTRDVKLWLPIQSDGAYLVTAQVLNASGQVLAEQSTQTAQMARADGAPLIATLADGPNLAAQLSRIEVPYQQGLTAQVKSVTIAPTEVPARGDYLAGFQGLVVQGASAASLTAEQKRAIQQWVVQGGDLVIAGGADASRAAAVLDGADGLGARFGELEGSTDLQPLADLAGGGGPLSAGPAAPVAATSAELLAGSRERPLAARATWGDGSVTLLAVDPTLDPLRGWPGTTNLLKRVLQPALAGAQNPVEGAKPTAGGYQPPHQDDSRLLSAIDALPADAFPDWQHVAVLLGGFALLVGPVLHLILWRTGHRTWLWVAVPGLSVLVAATMYAVTLVQPGRNVIANVVTEVRIDPMTGDAREAVAVGFFAPLRDQLSVHIPDEVPVRVSAGYGSSGALSQAAAFALGSAAGPYGSGLRTGVPLPGYRVITGRDTQVDYTSAASLENGLRSMVLSRGLPRGSIGQLEADLRIEGSEGVILGSVHNATPYAFEQVGLAIGQSIARVGPMAPGQTSSVTFDPHAAPPSAPGNLVYSFAWQLLGVPSTQANSSSGSLDMPGDPETRRRMKVLDAVFSSSDRTGGVYSANGLPIARPSTVRPMLVGLTNAAIASDGLPSAGAQRTFQESVIEVPVRLAIAPGPFTVPAALMPPTVGVESGASLNSGGPSTLAWLDLRGAATYTFRLDLPVNSRVVKLNVTTQQAAGGPMPTGTVVPAPLRSTTSGPSTQGTFSIYNWQTSAWQALTAGSREVALSPAEAFVGPDGSVRIQVTSGGADRTVRFLPPELTLQGEAAS